MGYVLAGFVERTGFIDVVFSFAFKVGVLEKERVAYVYE